MIAVLRFLSVRCCIVIIANVDDPFLTFQFLVKLPCIVTSQFLRLGYSRNRHTIKRFGQFLRREYVAFAFIMTMTPTKPNTGKIFNLDSALCQCDSQTNGTLIVKRFLPLGISTGRTVRIVSPKILKRNAHCVLL